MFIFQHVQNDNTKNIVLALAELDKRIRYIENRGNLGVSETRNRGVSLAQGQWIAFLDSDDMMRPDMTAKLYEPIRKNHCDIAVFFR
mgnify:CR=1 FL=1